MLKVTVRCGFVGNVLLVLLLPDMDDISGVVSVEVDAIVVLGGQFSGLAMIGRVKSAEGYHRSNGTITAQP